MGTGSGKTFRAVMLIKELGGEMGMDSKAVFLVNSVALVEQEAASIRFSCKEDDFGAGHDSREWSV